MSTKSTESTRSTQDKHAAQRRGMLAKIHMAKNDLALEDDTYRDLLEHEFRVRSAAKLTIGQMERLLGIFRAWGWHARENEQVKALRARAYEIAGRLPDGENRLKGLTKKICGVERLAWAGNLEKLERLLAVLGKIEREGYAPKKSK